MPHSPSHSLLMPDLRLYDEAQDLDEEKYQNAKQREETDFLQQSYDRSLELHAQVQFQEHEQADYFCRAQRNLNHSSQLLDQLDENLRTGGMTGVYDGNLHNPTGLGRSWTSMGDENSDSLGRSSRVQKFKNRRERYVGDERGCVVGICRIFKCTEIEY